MLLVYLIMMIIPVYLENKVINLPATTLPALPAPTTMYSHDLPERSAASLCSR